MAVNVGKIALGASGVAVISLLSLSGAVVVPLLRKRNHDKWMFFFVALAVATLSCDAVLHLIPKALGLHKHGAGAKHDVDHDHAMQLAAIFNETSDEHAGHDHEAHSDEHDDRHDSHELVGHDHAGHSGDSHDEEGTNTGPILTLLVSVVFICYLFETATHASIHRHSGAISTSNSSAIHPTNQHADHVTRIRISDSDVTHNNHLDHQKMAQTFNLPQNPNQLSHKPKSAETFLGLQPVAWFIVVGDAVHNFADGLAIGAVCQAVNSYGAIIATLIAVACHELPHEIGDFVILLETGLTVRKSLILNLSSSLTAFVGFGAGVGLGVLDSAQPWILSFSAAIFLYVAWVDMLNHMKERAESPENRNSQWSNLLLQAIGYLIGFGIMMGIGYVEELMMPKH